jgi:NAD(P)-dependent dehydrogenase (short-subunit alcohol dehydrogenase family)
VQAALPHLKKHGSGRIIVVSPPIYSRFFRGKTGYAMGKIGMSVLTKGLAMDFQRQGLTDMAITSIWPAVVSISLLFDGRLPYRSPILTACRLSSPQPRARRRTRIRRR